MSRSYNQRHPIVHSKKNRKPRSVLNIEVKDNKVIHLYKHIKLKPYGRKNFIGYGEEEYLRRVGEYSCFLTNKKRERRLAKFDIKDKLLDWYIIENNLKF